MPFIKRNSITYDRITRKFTQLNPGPEKQPKVELTKADKKRVLEEFRELFNRDPSPDELDELYFEERKLKRKKIIPKS